MDSLNNLVNATLAIEKLRIASAVRQSALAAQKRSDPETDELHRRLVDLEGYVDGRIAVLLKSHPAYPWFSLVKGIGKENIGKIIGLVRIKPSDEWVCMNRECHFTLPKTLAVELIVQGLHEPVVAPPACPQCGETMVDPPYANTISALWKFAGFAVEDGHAPKLQAGEKRSYNSRLRSMCWRVGVSLMRSGGKFYTYYNEQKTGYQQRYAAAGITIVPATALPKVNGKKTETAGLISEGHVHNQALRKMIKLFLSCLWLTWREAEGLAATKPYPIEKLGHTSFIDPWKMTDR